MTSRPGRIITYALYGLIGGLIFPIVSILSVMDQTGINPSLSTIKTAHQAQPLLLLVDFIPLVLSISFALIGLQSARYMETSVELDELISRQKTQIQNEHYFLEALIRSSSFAIVQLDTKHHIIACNPAFENLFGYSSSEIIGEHLDDMIASDDLYQEASEISKSVSAGNLVRKISQRKRKDGGLVDVEIVGVPVTVGGEKIGILGLYYDISQRIIAEEALRESEIRFRTLFDESPISLWEEDFSAVKRFFSEIGEAEDVIEKLLEDDELVQRAMELVKILNVNQATLDLYNAKSKADLLKSLSHVLVVESLNSFRNELIALVSGQTTFECEIYQKKLTGELVYGWLRLSLPPGYEDSWERVFISIIDITERKAAEEKLRYISFHDSLTGLYNRAYFEEELDRLESSRQFPVSMIVCDLDGLKQINDSQGHAVGDLAIKSAAKILGSGTFRKEDVIARTGGDEFVILLPKVDIENNQTILHRLDKAITRFNTSKIKDGLYRPINISYGHAVVQSGESLMEGFKKADSDMYAIKVRKKTKK